MAAKIHPQTSSDVLFSLIESTMNLDPSKSLSRSPQNTFEKLRAIKKKIFQEYPKLSPTEKKDLKTRIQTVHSSFYPEFLCWVEAFNPSLEPIKMFCSEFQDWIAIRKTLFDKQLSPDSNSDFKVATRAFYLRYIDLSDKEKSELLNQISQNQPELLEVYKKQISEFNQEHESSKMQLNKYKLLLGTGN